MLRGDAGATVTASGTLSDYRIHALRHLNDGLYSNTFSWLGASANSFAGISLGSTPVAVNRIAFGRDNNGTYTDRAAGFYTVQYTTEPNPTAVTTASNSFASTG